MPRRQRTQHCPSRKVQVYRSWLEDLALHAYRVLQGLAGLLSFLGILRFFRGHPPNTCIATGTFQNSLAADGYPWLSMRLPLASPRPRMDWGYPCLQLAPQRCTDCTLQTSAAKSFKPSSLQSRQLSMQHCVVWIQNHLGEILIDAGCFLAVCISVKHSIECTKRPGVRQLHARTGWMWMCACSVQFVQRVRTVRSRLAELHGPIYALLTTCKIRLLLAMA